MSENLGPRLLELVADVLQIEVPPGGELLREATPAWDSLGHLRVVMAVEDELGLRLEPDEVTAIASVADLHRVVEAKLGRPRAAIA